MNIAIPAAMTKSIPPADSSKKKFPKHFYRHNILRKNITLNRVVEVYGLLSSIEQLKRLA
jgi:hypothetical protein